MKNVRVIGIGLDGDNKSTRITEIKSEGVRMTILGGSKETHDEMTKRGTKATAKTVKRTAKDVAKSLAS